ncbi:hypothetical protein VOLCADRAFT_97639 [Volvox carteri f. nagariensis]|uniref:Uncharacterized protein n=1 Tax=Volvox carteri f. nagariensis TaxID=3068 RepID=D8UD88_VOLCA|nr:uncharacterized protein VOLCADRAFT_97639 [Volvox carteri f. nagariensis]EFJ42266.1 hypothetical protein VOLCADRAFT_97639 [Volvox carteri f. nagariensis]|eukprot:XP_002956664.1 hypothetical protein VOLCADRAFT_97639 [Volvox carteri f. nagariensis]
MDVSALIARRAQHRLAGPSSQCMPPSSVRSRSHCSRRAPSHAGSRARATGVCRSTGKTVTPSPLFEEVARDDGYLRVVDSNSAHPDYDDPDWISKVEDWQEFWNYQNWELEVEDLETEEGNMAGPIEALRRAEKLIDAFTEMDMRTDIVNWMSSPHSEDGYEEDKWINPPMDAERPDPNPTLLPWDLRAMAEKRQQRAMLDAEWRRRQSRIGKLTYPHMDQHRDVRVQRLTGDGYRYDWTEEEIRQLIVNNGLACRPEDHGAIVENPLAVQDYHALGVHYIEETEELLERTGHLAPRDYRVQYDREFILHGEDYGEDEDQLELDALTEQAEHEGMLEALGMVGLDEDDIDVEEDEYVGDVGEDEEEADEEEDDDE